MSADPESIVRFQQIMGIEYKKLNKVISGLTRVIDKNIRAQTKVIAMASKTKGMMLGVVADLELMGGAFGKIKTALGNLFLPVTKDTPKLFKYANGLASVSGAFEHILIPMKRMIGRSKDRVKTLNQEIAVKNEIKAVDKAMISGMSQMNKRFNLFSRLTGGKKVDKSYEKSQLAWLGGIDEKTGLSDMPTGVGWGMVPEQGKAPASMMGLKPLTKPSTWDNVKKGTKGLAELGTSKMKSGMKLWKKNVTNPIKQIASGGIGLGFQTTIIMGLMQAFSNLFTIFQPVIDVVGMLVERVSIGFMPLIEMLMEILTSPPVLAMVDMLAAVLAEVFEMFKPLVPIIIQLVETAMKPLFGILQGIMPVIQIIADLFATLLVAFMPLIDLLFGSLAPIIEFLTKVVLLLVVTAMYPLVSAIYVVGLGIAGLMDLFTDWTGGNVKNWNAMILPIFDALNVATGAIAGSFHTGIDYVPETGVYLLKKDERVISAQENLYGQGGGGQSITININGGIWVQDLDEFVNMLGRKLSLHRG